jgi:hypothetical protein
MSDLDPIALEGSVFEEHFGRPVASSVSADLVRPRAAHRQREHDRVAHRFLIGQPIRYCAEYPARRKERSVLPVVEIFTDPAIGKE